MLVQIYGVTTPGDAALVDSLRPDHVGVVLDEGIPTWDSVDEATAKAIVAALPHVRVVALSLASDLVRIRQTVAMLRPEIVHLARAEAMPVAEIEALRAELHPVELMLTVPVRGPEAIDLARTLAPSCDFLLLDSADPASGVVGATGLVHDWSLSRAVVQAVAAPVFLAGGLGPGNVEQAIRAVGPAGVDSETQTSRAEDRRRKDPELVRRFVELARAAGSPAAQRR